MSCTLTRTLSAGLLHTSFENVATPSCCDTVFRSSGLLLYFAVEVREMTFKSAMLAELGQDFILNAVGEISGTLFIAQIFERQHRNRFWRNRCRPRLKAASRLRRVEAQCSAQCNDQ